MIDFGNHCCIAQILVLSLGTCCPSREQRLLISCSPVPHHVIPEEGTSGGVENSFIMDFYLSLAWQKSKGYFVNNQKNACFLKYYLYLCT